MKNRIAALRQKMNPLALYCGALAFLASAAPALASSSQTSAGVIKLDQVSGAIQDIIALATGPVAKIVAILAIIGGAIAFSQGREMNEGLKNLGIVAVVIGLLIGATSIMGSVGATF